MGGGPSMAREVPLLVFDLRGTVGHYRRPDTAVTHATYPFPTRTALRGLLGAILGLPEWTTREAWTGVRCLKPVRTRAQELSMLGKGFFGSTDSFNRPTSVELLVDPAYRIYYTGPDVDVLAERIANRQSVYPTYLGSAFALTVPEFVSYGPVPEVEATALDVVDSPAVVPVHVVAEIEPVPGRSYARVGGVLHTHLGGRRFRRSLSFLYEPNAGGVRFRVAAGPFDPAVRFVRAPEGVVCLW